MQFLSLSILALAGFSVAQDLSEVGLVCSNLWGSSNPNKLDPTGGYVIDPSLCAGIGGKLVWDDIICCPKSNSREDWINYLQPCNALAGTTNWGPKGSGGPAPSDWRCPK